MTSPPCQLGKPHPGDARMCCIPLPRQLTSYAAEAGVCGVMPHESRTASDLGVTGTGRDQRGTVRAEPLGWSRSLVQRWVQGVQEQHQCRQQHGAHRQRESGPCYSPT